MTIYIDYRLSVVTMSIQSCLYDPLTTISQRLRTSSFPVNLEVMFPRYYVQPYLSDTNIQPHYKVSSFKELNIILVQFLIEYL